MSNELVARKLSGALGRRIDPAGIVHVDGDTVLLASGGVYSLAPSNTVYVAGAGEFWRNGKAWDPDTD